MRSWKSFFKGESKQEYFKSLTNFLKYDIYSDGEFYPQKKDIFNSFKYCSFSAIKVVIIGQDPYYNSNIADGLCFSVNEYEEKIPPSLKNIFCEINSDIGLKTPKNGCLKPWSKQGVFLLNSSLSVCKNKPGSHLKYWEKLTNNAISSISKNKKNIVFMLWGNHAQKKIKFINNQEKHFILMAPHPSPLSSYRGFFGCKHFSKCNDYLIENNIKAIDWSL